MKQILVEYNRDKSAAEQLGEIREEFCSGEYKSLLIHIFSGITDESLLTGIAKEIEGFCQTGLVVGTISAGEIKDGWVMSKGILVSAMLFRETEIQIHSFEAVLGREAEVGTKIRELLDSISDLKAAELFMPGTEMDTKEMFERISRCRKGIAIFGGYPGGTSLNSPEHFIFSSEGALYDALKVVTYAGKNLYVSTEKSIGWRALGLPFKVTKGYGKDLEEINDRPAAEVYEKFLRIDRKQHNNAEEAFEFPLLTRLNGDDMLRSVVHIREDGSLRLHGFVTEGMDVFLSYGDPSRIVETVNKRLEELCEFRPEVILLYSCIVRKTFWEDFVDMEMEPFARICSTSGFHTWGEILRDAETGVLSENNITLLSIGMREGEPKDTDVKSVRVDDTVLQGQASLLKRLTRLVYITMEELQKARQQLAFMAERDALTGLFNRGKIEQLINERLDMHDCVTSLVMVDLDFFKRINDTYGHDIGDTALTNVSDILADSVKALEGACAGRWGGEEFLILLPDVDEEAAMLYAEELRKKVEGHCFPMPEGLTISQGVVTVRECHDRKHVYKMVDDALYKSKINGRNRVTKAEWS